MTPQSSARVLILLSMVYGIAVAGLAMAGSGAVGIFAAIGGMTLGLLWFARSLFGKRSE